MNQIRFRAARIAAGLAVAAALTLVAAPAAAASPVALPPSPCLSFYPPAPY